MTTPSPESHTPVVASTAHRPSAEADISTSGVVRNVSGPDAGAWGWTPGDSIPEHLSISLEPILPGDTAELPFIEGGLRLRVAAREDGWTLTGYPERADAPTADSGAVRNAFIATLSHEIRTPLGSVNGFANLLMREIDDIETRSGVRFPEQVREFADAIAGETERLLAIVNDLFDHASLESGRIDVCGGTAELGAHIESAMERIRPVLDRKGVQLVRARIDNGLFVKADPRRIDRILDGLLSNAAKFTHEGSVVVSVRPEDRMAVVEITDTGVGISESYQANLFEAFTQEEDWRVRMHGGAGLGLALISRTLDLMGGRISVSSRKGIGSTFTIGIPMADAGRIDTDRADADHSDTDRAGNRPDARTSGLTSRDYSAHFRVHTGRSS